MSIQKKVTEKSAIKKSPAKASRMKKSEGTKKLSLAQERLDAMVSEAAYFAAQNDGYRKGSAEYWIEAETAIRAQFDRA